MVSPLQMPAEVEEEPCASAPKKWPDAVLGSAENTRMQDQDVIREFLVESDENLSRLDQELVELENRPKDAELLSSIFRCIHTIKGT
jgi:hypothetical protein